jgi:predicted metal-binding membrane protein
MAGRILTRRVEPTSAYRFDSQRWILLSATLGVAAVAWAILLQDQWSGSPSSHSMGMPQHLAPGMAGFLTTFAMWMVMMVAMMLPPVTPWILLFSRAGAGHGAPATPAFAVLPFVAGYFTVWAIFCAFAAAVQQWLDARALLAADGSGVGPLLGGGLLVLAGAFQLSPLKAACLKHCRSPMAYFLSNWRSGPIGGFRLGLGHGRYCLACCWALMLLSFALGVMNVLWMAILTLMLCVEKIAPRGYFVSRLFGPALIGWGLWLALVG